jgi:hypothetical protein
METYAKYAVTAGYGPLRGGSQLTARPANDPLRTGIVTSLVPHVSRGRALIRHNRLLDQRTLAIGGMAIAQHGSFELARSDCYRRP